MKNNKKLSNFLAIITIGLLIIKLTIILLDGLPLVITASGRTFRLENIKPDTTLSDANASFIGEQPYDHSGCSITIVGDVNNDGYDDILIGAHGNDQSNKEAGKTYLIFGRPSNQLKMSANLSEADTSFVGEKEEDFSGYAVAGVGDVNNDGYDDILIGAYGYDRYIGETYLIFGRPTTQWNSQMSLSEANASFIGEGFGDHSGSALASAGDVNNDGYDDILIGAYSSSSTAGQTYLLFGRESSQLYMRMSLSSANTSFIGEDDGGEEAGDYSGYAVAGAGDINNDGYDDLVIGAYRSNSGAGQTYLIFGRPTAQWNSQMSLSEANASFLGESSSEYSGYAVAGAGDVNNDNYDDILIGAYQNKWGKEAGKTYLIFGGPTAQWSLRMLLSETNTSFIGESDYAHSGNAVSGAGDINNDGYDDILIGAYEYGDIYLGMMDAGETYLIFGRPINQWSSEMPLSEADASFIGEGSGDRSGNTVAGTGDVNNDGYDDILIGAQDNHKGGVLAGQTYLILGKYIEPSEFDTVTKPLASRILADFPSPGFSIMISVISLLVITLVCHKLYNKPIRKIINK